MTAVSYIWRRDVDPLSDRPNVYVPSRFVCGSQSAEDVMWSTCDLPVNHPGPHAELAPGDGDDREVIAVWHAGSTPSDPEVRAEV